MPEISNNFRLGKMEKDLDDRLVPDGSYRDALNVEIATSEGSNVGALQKVLGNTRIGTIGSMTNAICIGSVRDTENNKIYWFITSDSRDVIAEYDEASGTTTAVLVDNGSNLKFNASYLITGVNILDGVLYFTDNLNEPKEVNILFWKNQTVNFETQSTNLSEDKITVIKKSPIKALEYSVLSNTVVSGYGTSELDSIPIKAKISGSAALIISTLDVGSIISDITFVNLDGTSISNPATNLKYISKDIVNNISGSKVTLTNENGSKAIIEILSRNITSNTDVFTAELIYKDDDLALVENVNQVGQMSCTNAQPIGTNSPAGTLGSQISNLDVYIIKRTNSLRDFTIKANGVYNINFEIGIDTVNLGANIFYQLVIYKNDIEILHTANNFSNQTGVKNISLNNIQLLGGETVGIGMIFTSTDIGGSNSTLGINDIVEISSQSNNSNNFDYSISLSDLTTITSEYTAITEQIIGHFEKKFPRFSYRYKYNNNQYSTYAPFSEIAFVPGVYEYDTKNGFNLAMRNTISSVKIKNFRDNIPETVKEIDILYKDTVDQNVYIVDTVKKKSQSFTGNGSNKIFTITTSSFSNPLPLTKNELIVKINNVLISRTSYSYTSSSGQIEFNNNLINSIVQQTTGNNAGAPKISTTIFIEGFQESLEIKDEEIYKVDDSVQLLRHFDNLPKKALAQEIIGNRLVYANYTENYDYNLTPVFNISLNSISTAKVNGAINNTANLSVDNNSGIIAVGDVVTGSGLSNYITVNTVTNQNTLVLSSAQTLTDDVDLSFRTLRTDTFNQKLSLKSNRTYQLGIVFIDEYGRKTPVFTGSTGQFFINQDNSVNRNFIKVSTSTTAPPGITHFQYYIKEPSQEYYNIALSNFYDDDRGFLYLMCSSADINKIKVEDYISLKKKNALNEGFINPNNKFKVVDIIGKTPDFLAKTFNVDFASNYVIFGDNFNATGVLAKTTKTPGFTPVKGFNKVLIKDIVETTGIPEVYRTTHLATGNKIRFISNGSRKKSKVYEIGAVAFPNTGTSTPVYIADIQFTESFGNDIEFLYDTSAKDSPITGVGIEFISEADDRGNQAYDNKFFIKVKDNVEVSDALKSKISQNDLTIISSSILQSKANSDSAISNNVSTSARSYIFKDFGNNTITINTAKSYVDSDSFYYADGFGNNLKVNNYIRISDNNFNNKGVSFSKVFRIKSITTRPPNSSATSKSWKLVLDQNLPGEIISNSGGGLATASYTSFHRFDIMNIDSENTSSLTNPAVIEVIPDNGFLDLYYEDKDIFPIGQLSDPKSLTYSNCVSFENGVESDRIRDDFNAPIISKGVILSTVFEDAYNEEVQTNRFIYSGIYNANSSVNRLNQFIIAEKITKDINPSHGSIQLIKTRDTDLITLCEDKCFRIQANKDALFTADGNTNVTASSNVLGQVIPYIGEYGISKNPESFAQYGFRAYFSDKARGVILRLSRDGLSEVSALGMSDFFSDKLANANGNIFGSYDDRKNSYNLSFTNQLNNDTAETISFNERVNGWTSRKSFVPETAISLNNNYFSFKVGDIYKHHSNTETNDFYTTTTAIVSTHKANGDYELVITNANTAITTGMYVYFDGIANGVDLSGSVVQKENITIADDSQSGDTVFYLNAIIDTIAAGTKLYFSKLPIAEKKSSVKFLINKPLGQVKRFKTLNYEGDTGWLLNSISTPEHAGEISSDGFVKKEGKYFAAINGKTATASTINSENLQVQGLGVCSVSNNTIIFNNTSGEIITVNSSLQVGDNIYFLSDNNVSSYTSSGTCLTKSDKTITVSGTLPSTGNFVLFDKGGTVNQSGLLGFFAEVEMKHTGVNSAELFSVGSLIV